MKFKSVLGLVTPFLVQNTYAQDLEFTILHINDFHARVRGMVGTGGCSASQLAAGECDGGWSKILTAAKDFVEESANPVIFIDNGDQFAGTIWSSFYQGLEVYTLKNILCEEAGFFLCLSGVGNHEFDFGYEPLYNYVSSSNHQFINSNIVDNCAENSQGTHEASGIGNLLADSLVVEISGTSVAFVGYVTPETPSISSPPDCLQFLDEEEALEPILDTLSSEGVDVVIVIGHSGVLRDLEISTEFESDIDLIVGGHSHTFLWNEAEQGAVPAQGRPVTDDEGVVTGIRQDTPTGLYPIFADDSDVPVVQAYFGGRYLGAVSLSFSNGNLTDFSREAIIVADTRSPVADQTTAFDVDADMEVAIEELEEPLNVFAQTPVGTVGVTFEDSVDGARRIRMQEMPLGNVACDAMMAAINSNSEGNADICMQNAGGIRSSIEEGDVTFEEVITVFPFANVLSVVEFTGERVFAALEHGFERVGTDNGEFLHFGEGFQVYYDPLADAGDRVINVSLNGEEILNDDSQTFDVVTNSFIAAGGDGYGEIFTEAPVILELGDPQEDALADYIADNPGLCQELEGRIIPIQNPVDIDGNEIDVLGVEFPSCEAQDSVTFTILHINDMHARVQGMRGTGGCSTEQNDAAECDGGWARLMAAGKRFVEESDHPVIFIDNGDQFAGTSWSTFYQGTEVYTFENLLCDPENGAGFAYCFSGMGNHEFDFGYEVLLDMARNMEHDIITANIDDSCAENAEGEHDEGELGSYFKKSSVVDISGVSVGFVGYTLEGTPGISSPPDCLTFSEEGEAIQNEIDALAEDGVSIFIAIGHSGINKDLEVATSHPEVDLIIGGHTHTFLWNEAEQGPVPAQSRPATDDEGAVSGIRQDSPSDVYPVFADESTTPVLQQYFGGRYLGAVELTFSISTGDLVSLERKSVLLANENSPVVGATGVDEVSGEVDVDPSKGYAEDEDMKELIDELFVPLQVFGSTAVGYTPVLLDQTRVRLEETPLGNLICDSMVYNLAQKGTQVDACIQNGGGIRASLEAGIVTYEDVISVLPFSNVLSVLEFTPARLFAAFEFGLEGDVGAFPQTSSGVNITYNNSRAEGARISSFFLNGVELDRNDEDTNLLLVTNNFIANGGDNYGEIMTGAPRFLENGDPQEEAFVTYLGVFCPSCAEVEGRLSNDENPNAADNYEVCSDEDREECPVLSFEGAASLSSVASICTSVVALVLAHLMN
eukprot:snap_masked-scaffold_19-processed-gene-5.31-mRNA-1 protein AED:1.00 eAED:1.00 QI:0/-1/0/0/-1/1/1/0/1225